MRDLAFRLLVLVTFQALPIGAGATRLAAPASDSERVVRVGVLLSANERGDLEPECEFQASSAAPPWLVVDSGPSRLSSSNLPKCSTESLVAVSENVARASLNRQAGVPWVVGAMVCGTVAVSAAYMRIKNVPLRGTAGVAIGAYGGALATAGFINGVHGFSQLIGGLGVPIACYMVGEGVGDAFKSVAYIWEKV